MSRLQILIRTHHFTCASYNPFESLPADDKGHTHILVMIGAGRVIPHQDYQHFGRFGTTDVIHTDQGPAFCNELFSKLLRLSRVENSPRIKSSQFTSYSQYDPRFTEYPVPSYVLFTPPVGRGPFQVMDKSDSIYTIEDVVSSKITIHIHNLRPFIFYPICRLIDS